MGGGLEELSVVVAAVLPVYLGGEVCSSGDGGHVLAGLRHHQRAVHPPALRTNHSCVLPPDLLNLKMSANCYKFFKQTNKYCYCRNIAKKKPGMDKMIYPKYLQFTLDTLTSGLTGQQFRPDNYFPFPAWLETGQASLPVTPQAKTSDWETRIRFESSYFFVMPPFHKKRSLCTH